MPLSKFKSYKKGIISSLFLNTVSKTAAVFSVLIVGYYFGTQKSADVYFFLLSVILVLTAFSANINSAVIIPNSMKIETQAGREENIRFLNFFLYVYVFAAIILLSLLFLDSQKALLFISNFDQNTAQQNSNLLRLGLVFIALRILINYLSEIAFSFKFFTVPIVANMLIYTFAVVSTLLLHGKYSINSVFIGFILGAICHLCLLIFIFKKHLNWKFFTKVHLPKTEFLQKVIFAKIWSAAALAAQYIPMFLLSGFSQGVVSSVNYSKQTSEAPAYFLSAKFSQIAGIKLNELTAENGLLKDINEIFIKSSKLLIFILTAIAAVTFVYSNEIITLLFQRGEFKEESVRLCSSFLKLFICLLPLNVFNMFVDKISVASQKIKQVMYYQTAASFILVFFVFLLIDKMGPSGYPVALLLAALINLAGLYFYCRHIFPWLEYLSTVKYLFLTAVVNIALGFVFFKLKPFIYFNILFVDFAVAAILYFMALTVLSMVFNLNSDFNHYLKKLFRLLAVKSK